MAEIPIALQAKAILEKRKREERARLGPKYDWYGDECPCGLPLGECREHPRARPNQRPPGSYRAAIVRADWRVWLICAARGYGKTYAGAKMVQDCAQSGSVKWIALISGTVKDVRDVMIEHPDSGLLSDAVSPPWCKPLYEPSKARVTWPNGVIATIYSSEAPGDLRGPQFDLAWVDELAKWEHNQKDVWDNLSMCMRRKTEPRTRVVVTTTPRDTPTFNEVYEDRRTVITHGTTMENQTHLDDDFIRDMHEKYEGTRWGDQELRGILRRDNPDALWTHELTEAAQLDAIAYGVTLRRIVLAVDPNAGSNNPESGAETGIIVGGLGSDGICYLLADLTCKGTPGEWAAAAVRGYQDFEVDRIVAEKNQGGLMVEHTLRSVPGGQNLPITLVWAYRGSELRAEPVVALYEKGKVKHVGPRGKFANLERQMQSYKAGVPKKNQPDRIDRLDAAVYAVTELMLEGGAKQSGRIVLAGDRPSLHR